MFRVQGAQDFHFVDPLSLLPGPSRLEEGRTRILGLELRVQGFRIFRDHILRAPLRAVIPRPSKIPKSRNIP